MSHTAGQIRNAWNRKVLVKTLDGTRGTLLGCIAEVMGQIQRRRQRGHDG
jgi:hypothetical protein